MPRKCWTMGINLEFTTREHREKNKKNGGKKKTELPPFIAVYLSEIVVIQSGWSGIHLETCSRFLPMATHMNKDVDNSIPNWNHTATRRHITTDDALASVSLFAFSLPLYSVCELVYVLYMLARTSIDEEIKRKRKKPIASSIVRILLVLVYIFIVRFKLNFEIYLVAILILLRSHWKLLLHSWLCIICVLYLFNTNC